MAKVKVRAVGVLIRDVQVLLIHRFREGKEFWVLPGGTKEDDETVEEAVVREVFEETSIKCKVNRALYKHIYTDTGDEGHYYLCEYLSGTPKLGDYNEVRTMQEEDQSYEPKWVSVDKLPDLLLYPLEIRDWLIEDLKNGFEDTPRTQSLKTTELRRDT